MTDQELMLSMLRAACEVGALLYLSENSTYEGMENFEVFGGFIRAPWGEWTGQFTLFRDKRTGKIYVLTAEDKEVPFPVQRSEDWPD